MSGRSSWAKEKRARRCNGRMADHSFHSYVTICHETETLTVLYAERSDPYL